MLRKIKDYFTPAELGLWGGSAALVCASFFTFDRSSYHTLAASLIGVTSLIFAAKGHPVSQVLMIIFSLLYGAISWSFSYYGEMITYLGMTLPMAVIALVSWVKNPFKGNRSEVAVNRINGREQMFMWLLTTVVTVVFYFILRRFNTANLIPSTISVATSFSAVYLTLRRDPRYALAYGANDVVLIILWTLASLEDTRYISVLACFAAFLANDVYGYISWKAMEKRQRKLSAGSDDRQ